HAETDADAVVFEAGLHLGAAEVEALLLVVAVAVFDTRRDVVGHEGFGTGTGGPADHVAVVLAGTVLHLDIGAGDAGRAVDEDRVHVDADAATDRAVNALLALQAVALGIDARIVQ